MPPRKTRLGVKTNRARNNVLNNPDLINQVTGVLAKRMRETTDPNNKTSAQANYLSWSRAFLKARESVERHQKNLRNQEAEREKKRQEEDIASLKRILENPNQRAVWNELKRNRSSPLSHRYLLETLDASIRMAKEMFKFLQKEMEQKMPIDYAKMKRNIEVENFERVLRERMMDNILDVRKNPALANWVRKHVTGYRGVGRWAMVNPHRTRLQFSIQGPRTSYRGTLIVRKLEFNINNTLNIGVDVRGSDGMMVELSIIKKVANNKIHVIMYHPEINSPDVYIPAGNKNKAVLEMFMKRGKALGHFNNNKWSFYDTNNYENPFGKYRAYLSRNNL